MLEVKEIITEHKEYLTDIYKGKKFNLINCDLSYCSLTNADLRGAKIINCDLSCSNLSYCDLRGAEIINCNLINCNLRKTDLRGVNLINSDLSFSDLRYCSLTNADLRGANLFGACIDFSVFPLWCGGLGVHIDDRLATQLLYHLVKNVKYSKNTSAKMKKLLSLKSIVKQANKFHLITSCGRIKND